MSSSSPQSYPHKTIKSLEPFLGTWRGEGLGFYPTIKVFKYGEEATFTTWGKPIVGYSHKTWNLDTKAPMHYESGFFRVSENGRIEFINAQPTGVTEIDEGVYNAERNSIELNSKIRLQKNRMLRKSNAYFN